MVTGVIVLISTACNKEQLTPAVENHATAGTIGEAKKAGGSDCFAIVGVGGGSELHLVDHASPYDMTFIANITDLSGNPVDHFMGISWDPGANCTWLVTDNSATNPSHRNLLWRITGALPNTVSGPIAAEPMYGLTRPGGGVLQDAMDIEIEPSTGSLYLLRNTLPSKSFATINTSTGRVTNVAVSSQDIQGFTFDCKNRMVGVKSASAAPTLYLLNRLTGATVGSPMALSPLFTATDAGIEPHTGCSTLDLFCVNNAPVPSMAMRLAPFWVTNPTFRPTYDMTTM
jgi:hypothetical protein